MAIRLIHLGVGIRGRHWLEIVAGHRLLTFQAEGQVLNGTDADADRIAAFALELFARVDGRPIPSPAAPARSTGSARSRMAAATATTGRTRSTGTTARWASPHSC